MSTKLWDLNQAAIVKDGLRASTRGAGITNSVTGPTMDMIESDGPCHLISNIAFFSGSGGPTFDAKVQESSDDSVYTDITGAAITQVTTAVTTQGATPQIVQFQRTKRYLRLVTTVGGTTNPLYVGDIFVLSQKKNIYS